MFKNLLILISVIPLSSCSTLTYNPTDLGRIVYSSIEVTTPDKATILNDIPLKPIAVEFKSNKELKKPYIVQFGNESALLTDNEKKRLLNNIEFNPNEIYVVIGQSHGISGKGTLYLSSERAEKVANFITKRGVPVDNVLIYSSWSDRYSRWAINRGVLVHTVTDPKTLITLPIFKKTSLNDNEY